MKRIRTKLVLSLLVSTLLPIYPVYYQVKNLLQQSIEVGYNEKVEMALDPAAAKTLLKLGAAPRLVGDSISLIR